MKSRGQVTIFVIIGLVIVLSLVFIMMLSSDSEIIHQPETEEDELGVFVSECLKQTAEEALQQAGMRGGYINLHNELPSEDYTIDSPYLSMHGGAIKMPYWAYMNTEGLQASEMPPLYKNSEGDNSIQSQLENYIESNISSCLNDFEHFESQNIEINEKSLPEASVDFTNEKVLIDLDYGLNINKNSSVVRKESFKASLPVRMKKVYSLAKDITQEEMNTAFLEDKLRDLINAHSRIDGDYLPPMYGGMQMTSCANREFWVTNKVREDFRNMLTGNIPYIQIENANNRNYQIDTTEFDSDKNAEVAQGVMNRLTARVSEEMYPKISADFMYDTSFPMELNFGEGGFLEPKSLEMDLVIGNYCFFEYRFFYDTKVPILVTLYDEASDVDDNGYMFQFPVMLVLKDNFPKVRWDGGTPSQEPEFKNYQCSRKQRLSDAQINVTDERGGPVEDAYISFQCGPSTIYDRDENGSVTNATRVSNKCFIGTTDENGIMDEGLPPCYGGGILEVKAQNHLSRLQVVQNIEEGQEYNYSFTLPRVVEKDVVVDKFFVEPPVPEGLSVEDRNPSIVADDNGNVTECNLGSQRLPLKANEQAIIRLKKLDPKNGIMEVKPFGLFTTSTNTTISLAPGKYRADIMLIREEQYPGEMTIKKNSQVRKVDGGGVSSDETIYYPEEDVEIPTVTTGGAVYEFEITESQLYDSEKIRFHVIDEGKPQFVENVGRAMNDRKPCSRLNLNRIKPELTR